jgi:hypothetical protein
MRVSQLEELVKKTEKLLASARNELSMCLMTQSDVGIPFVFFTSVPLRATRWSFSRSQILRVVEWHLPSIPPSRCILFLLTPLSI